MAQIQILEGTMGTEQTGNSSFTGQHPYPPNPGDPPHLPEPPNLSQLMPHTEDSPCCPCQSWGSGGGGVVLGEDQQPHPEEYGF